MKQRTKLSPRHLYSLAGNNKSLSGLMERCSHLLRKNNFSSDQLELSLSDYQCNLEKRLKIIEEGAVTDEVEIPQDILLLGLLNIKQKKQKRLISKLQKIDSGYKDLMRMISHEFKNSLTSIHGYNRIIHKNFDKDNSKLKDYSVNIERLVGNLYGLVDSLYGLSVSDENRLKINKRLFDVVENALLPILAEMQLRLSQKKMRVTIQKENDKTIFYGDEVLFQSIFRNLILNAVQYGIENTEIEITIREDEKHLYLSIKNKGTDLDHLSDNSIFSKYSRFHKEKEKTNIGIGLYVVKKIVELYKGTIQVETENNKIAHFKIAIPKRMGDK